MPGVWTSIVSAGMPRATRSSRVLSLIAIQGRSRNAQGMPRSRSQTPAATGHDTWSNAVAPNR